MHANTYNLCITGPVLVPAVWTDYEKIAQKKNCYAYYCFQECQVSPSTLSPGSSFSNQVYLWSQYYRNKRWYPPTPPAPLCSRNRRYPLVPLYTSAGTALVLKNILVPFHTSDGTALVPRNVRACLGIVTPSLQFWPPFDTPLLETGRGSNSCRSHLTTNA